MCLWRRGSQAYCVCKHARGGWETADVSDSLHPGLEWPSTLGQRGTQEQAVRPHFDAKVSGQAKLVWAYNIAAEPRFRP